ncbi:MAG: cobalt ECF transporter T component CbiQ [Pseudonocardiales bacterium]|nr:cobalt ECF transporter T component CbiQ [Pseudonocardiales bacterium]MBV9029488.1 cobalt ECF transporter T component CbiQ [Pseudonocardiales bacterium]MBW0008957.1 cobalt ECF transporter T component CbiQ [Pseudonocardiales bacterium]
MSAAHLGLLVPADTPVHRLAPQCKVAATALFVLAVAATPAGAYRPYLWYLLLLAALAALARLPPLTLSRRLLVEVPFLLFVLALPVLDGPPRLTVLAVRLSVPGLHAAATIALKATFGLLTTGILAATTPLPEIITGLERLRVPRVFTAVAAFMVRYTEVLAAELARTRTAAVCRGGSPRWFWQVHDVTAGLGALVVRSFERGERVYLAMVSRGYTGAVPTAPAGAAASRVAWTAALAVPALAAIATVLG